MAIRHKICYIGNFALMSVGETEIANSLEELDHVVFRLPERGVTPNQVYETVIAKNCDVLLFAKCRILGPAREKLDLFDKLRKRNVAIVAWCFDLYWDL